MKSLVEICEGFFQNVGADPASIVMKYINPKAVEEYINICSTSNFSGYALHPFFKRVMDGIEPIAAKTSEDCPIIITTPYHICLIYKYQYGYMTNIRQKSQKKPFKKDNDKHWSLFEVVEVVFDRLFRFDNIDKFDIKFGYDDVHEGFFQNVGADIRTTVLKFTDAPMSKSIWMPEVVVNDDKHAHDYSIVFTKDSTVIKLHNEKAKTDRKDIKIDMFAEWDTCFQYLLNPNVTHNDDWKNHVVFSYNPVKKEYKSWMQDTLWIYKKPELFHDIDKFYVYNIDKQGNCSFKKIIENK